MINIYWQKNTLNDILLINLSVKTSNKIENKNNIVYGYCNNELAFINILNFSKYYDKKENGLFLLTDQLNKLLLNLTGINLIDYLDNGFKICEIISCEPIVNTHLHQCTVNVGKQTINLICGANNVRVGLKTVICLNNTYLYNGKLISTGKIMNFTSNGMLCSYKELGINKQSNGIIELDSNYKIGDFFLDCYCNCHK